MSAARLVVWWFAYWGIVYWIVCWIVGDHRPIEALVILTFLLFHATYWWPAVPVEPKDE